jgi:dihydroneopterin aldolase
MGKIVLEGMEFYAFHGVFAEEKRIGGRYLVDVEVFYPFENNQDQLSDTVDYSILYEIVARHMHQPAQLIEYVAIQIKNEISARFPGCESLVRVSKMAPPLGGRLSRTYVEV